MDQAASLVVGDHAVDWRSTNFFIFDGAASDADTATVLRGFQGFLDAYEDSGLNAVSLTWFNPVDTGTGEILQNYGGSVPDYLQSLPTDRLLIELTEVAHARGFKVMWKPHFVTNDENTGNINPAYVSETFDVANFLDSVDEYWGELAPVANAAQADLLIVGTEHADYAGPSYDAEWRQIIRTIEQSYSGELTYDALSYVGRPRIAADDITFWDALDYIGVSMYLPLAGDGPLGLSEAREALYSNTIQPWEPEPEINVPALLQSLSESTGKPVLFTEAGSQSRSGALESPPYTTGSLNFFEQAVIYATLLQEFSQFDWFEGINWWNNDHDFKEPPGSEGWRDFWSDLHRTEFGFLEKPSGDVVKAFWKYATNFAPVQGVMQLGDEDSEYWSGGQGDDLIVSAGGADTVLGGGGDDRLFAGDGADLVHGGWGNDVLVGGSSFRDGDDILRGEGGNDTLESGYGNDTLTGDAGADHLDGQGGHDLLIGGSTQDVSASTGAAVYRLYQATLDRSPDTTGFENWSGRLEAGSVTLLEVITGFVGSREFQATYGNLDNPGFVSLLYNNVLDREADAQGLANWTGRLNDGMSREEVVRGFSESAEFQQQTNAGASAYVLGLRDLEAWADDMYRLYQATLDRAPDLIGLTSWSDRLATGTDYLDVATGFMGSPEFQATYGALDNAGFVRLLYNNVLDRDPDAQGLANWTGRLNDGMSREEVVRGFAQSGEFIAGTDAPFRAFMEATGGDTFDGGPGDDILFGSFLADRFVFDLADKGQDRVLQVNDWDEVVFNGFGYADADAARDQMREAGSDVLFADRGVSVIFMQSTLEDFDALTVTV